VQTLNNRPAKGLTSNEFADVMAHFKKLADLAYVIKRSEFPVGGPLFAFDHAPWHRIENLKEKGFTDQEIFPVPARSPDFQKTIEHIFAYMTKKFQDKLYETDYSELHTAQQYREYVVTMFQDEVTKLQIKKDVASLKYLYDIVRKSKADGGVDGGWPPSKYT
jgi:hypothetical protein